MAGQIEHFGTTKAGQDVQRIRLKNNALTANIVTYGASIQDLRFDGHAPPLVLGFDDVSSYETHGLHFGAVAGRCVNRISGGRFTLNGKDYRLVTVQGQNYQLHGGPQGFGNRIWKIEEVTENSVLLSIESADGDMGYPGNLTAYCRYSLSDENALAIELSAECDAPTICNMSNHAYFNLEDGGVSDVNLHRLQVAAEQYLPLNEDLVPKGLMADVSGTQYDFRAIRPVGDYSSYDINFCLSEEKSQLRQVARLRAPSSGIVMDVETTETGLQLYGAKDIAPQTPGLEEIVYHSGSALCLEAQIWPDAINQPSFPNVVLMPGETLIQKTSYRFSKEN